MDSWSVPDTYCKANSLTCEKKEWWMVSKGWIFIFLEAHPEHHSCWSSWLSYKSNLLLVGVFFLLMSLVPHRYPPPPPLWREVRFSLHIFPPHGEVSLVKSGRLPALYWWDLLMPPPTPLFKIYVPTRLAINHGTCSVGSQLQQESKEQTNSLQRLWFSQWTPPTWLIREASTGLIGLYWWAVPGSWGKIHQVELSQRLIKWACNYTVT